MENEELMRLALDVATAASARERVKRELVQMRDRKDARASELRQIKEGYKSIKAKFRVALIAFENCRDKKEVTK